MKLVYADPQPVPGVTPSTLQILQNVEALAGHCNQVTLLTPESSLSSQEVLGRDLPDNVTVHHVSDQRKKLKLFSSSNRFYFWQLKKWLKTNPADAILVRNIKLADRLLPLPDCPPLYFESHELFAQSFLESHDLNSLKNKRKHKALLKREHRVYRNCQGLITLTQALADDLKKAFGVNSEILVAPDGYDEYLANQAKEQPVCNNPEPEILYLGSLHPWKGVSTAIDAMMHIEGARLKIVGGTDERIAELKEKCRKLGIENKVHFAGPIAPLKRFHEVHKADICILPLSNTSIGSRYTSPLKLFEYMAMGKAIVSADVPAIREVLTHGKTALLVEPNNSKAFEGALGALINSSVLRKKLSVEASLSANQYSWLKRAHLMTTFMKKHMGE